MDKLKLNQLVKDYLELQTKEEDIKNKKDVLKESIIELMGDEVKYDNGYATTTITLAESFKYNNEVSAIKTLKLNGYEKFITEEINTKEFNKFMKNNLENEMVKKLLSEDISKTTTKRLTIKEN